jgi:hypothetical protein
MPTAAAALKTKARAVARHAEALPAFLAVVNGEAIVDAHQQAFDPSRYSSHAYLRAHFIRLAHTAHRLASLADKHSAFAPPESEMRPDGGWYFLFDDINRASPVDRDETREALSARMSVAFEVNRFLATFLFDAATQGFRLLSRCSNPDCRRWFFDLHRSPQYCRPGCRVHRRPGSSSARVARHRSRQRGVTP